MQKLANALVLMVAATAIAALFALTRVAGAPPASTPPPGVEAADWHPISETLGLALKPAAEPKVVTQPDRLDVTFQAEKAFVEGVLMARVDGTWRVVSPATPARDELKAGRLQHPR